MIELYSIRDVARILAVQESRLRYWMQTGFVGPTVRKGGRFYYTFTDVVAVKAAKDLLAAEIPLQRVRKSVEALKKALPNDTHPTSKLRVCSDGNTIVALQDDVAFEPVGGQVVMAFTLPSFGEHIAEVLAMSAAEAVEFFADVAVKGPAAATLARMVDVGLGYITLGQALNTLSGGERQRLKLAISMAKKGAVYVLDEPTTGLHLADVDNLLTLLDRLVDAGNSVVVIEHHQAVMAHADWIIDLGPGAGHDGGTVVFEGTPADLVVSRASLTAQHLAAYVGS